MELGMTIFEPFDGMTLQEGLNACAKQDGFPPPSFTADGKFVYGPSEFQKTAKILAIERIAQEFMRQRLILTDLSDLVVRVEPYSCLVCQGDWHANWKCPTCGCQNIHGYWDFVANGQLAPAKCDTCLRCNTRVVLLRQWEEADGQ